MISLKDAEVQVRRLASLDDYPSTPEGVMELVKIAAMARDKAWCAKVIGYFVEDPVGRCPRPFALKQEISPPQPETYHVPQFSKCPHGKCDGTGWSRVFVLVSEEDLGLARFKRKTEITLQQYEELAHKVDWQKQSVYEGSRKCTCRGGTEPSTALAKSEGEPKPWTH